MHRLFPMTPARRRRRPWGLAAALLLLLSVAAAQEADDASSSSSSLCGDRANTLVHGNTSDRAIAYDPTCGPRFFDVRSETPTERSLNLSNLNLERVVDYPVVFTMLLSDNRLTTFQTPPEGDTDMKELDLHNNLIVDLTTTRFPSRLATLNLNGNRISSIGPNLSVTTLRSLTLDDNPVEAIDTDAFSSLTSLQYLSLSGVSLPNMKQLNLPSGLGTLDLSRNALTSDAVNFSTPLTALKSLDLSENRLTKFPNLSAFVSLQNLNLAANVITAIDGVRFPPALKSLDIRGNALKTFEIAESDVAILQQLSTFRVATTGLGKGCSNSDAKPETVKGVTVCVLSDDSYSTGGRSTAQTPNPSDSSQKDTSPNDGSNSKSAQSDEDSSMSTKSILLIAGGCFAMGLLVAAFVFVVKRERRSMQKNAPMATFAPEVSGGSDRHDLDANADRDGSMDEYTNASWVFNSPAKMTGMLGLNAVGPHNVVAILEDDRNRRGRGRSKVEDLLVYEIPLDEILIKEPMVQKQHGEEVMYRAEFQGYQVVMHALLQRGKRRHEREFIEQVRLASTLEHMSIVQFIGITLGSHSHSQRTAHKWKMGAVFEYMSKGSLATVFHEERVRREGKQYHAAATLAEPPTTTFTWYPTPQLNGATDHSQQSPRCKLSMALDVAMALVYLHAMGLIHGDICAEKVLVNELGEGKLSGMDVDLGVNVPGMASTQSRMDMRASAVRAKMRVKQIFSTSISQSPALDSSLLQSKTPIALTSATSSMLGSLHNRTKNRGMHGDIYAFGLLLWELDTMMTVDTMRNLTAATTESGEEHQMLRFSPECPSEIQFLARRCWHPEMRSRPTALDLQEELVRLLEGRLTVQSGPSGVANHRWSRRTRSSAAASSSYASSRSSEVSDFVRTSIVIDEAEV